MTPEARLVRAQRWQAFYDEPMGLSYMFGTVTASIMREATEAEPWETEKMAKATMALNILGELHGVVKGVLADGKVAEHALAHAAKISELSPARRRRL